MTRNELRTLIKQNIATPMRENGFRTKSLCFYKIRENVLCYILFNTKSYGYECGAYIQPLYIPHTALVLELGDSFERMDWPNGAKYSLWTDYSKETIFENLNNIILYCKKTVFSWLEDIGSPTGIVKNILHENDVSKKIFTPSIWRYEAAAYSELYLGNMESGKQHLIEYSKVLPFDSERQKEINLLMNAINASSDAVFTILQNNVQISKKSIGI